MNLHDNPVFAGLFVSAAKCTSLSEVMRLHAIWVRNQKAITRREHAVKPAHPVRLAGGVDRAHAALDRREHHAPRPKFGGAKQVAFALVDAAVRDYSRTRIGVKVSPLYQVIMDRVKGIA